MFARFNAALAWVVLLGAPAWAETPTVDSQAIAARLAETTVTVRVSAPRPSAAAGEAPQPVAADVTVASGVSLGQGHVVTFVAAPADSRFRVTLADGGQAEADVRVIDMHSGLTLLGIENQDLPALSLAAGVPSVGAPVLTAAASGIERPLVSLGILGGVDRSLPSSGLPPLLQCDLRTTDSSAGAPVVDAAGQLIGVVAATATQQGGWTYALPVSHVERLLAAEVEGSTVVLRRQRPQVGMTLGPGEREGTVRVDRVLAGSAADKAGVQAGDTVLSADGRQLRSAYQAVNLILKKQPGEAVELSVERSGEAAPLAIRVPLEGGITRSVVRAGDRSEVHVGPQLTARAAGADRVQVERPGEVAEVAVGDAAADPDAAAPAPRLPRDEVSLLRAQLAAFDEVIRRLQAELDRRDEAQQHTNELIESLTAEIAELREKLPPQE
jgi:S1-C subfamily serine protease